MVITDEEYIAESRDGTPELLGMEPEQTETEDVIETGHGTTPIHGILKKTMNGDAAEGPKKLAGENIKQEERVPDMQLGKCRYVRLHDNVNYVAAGLILRNEGDATEILLIQEAKKSCYGKWYMPAGRVEAGETLEASVMREVREETGYSCDVVELLSMQVQGSGWYRFSFYCTVTGGDLKTQADRESLAAQWFPVQDVLQRKIDLRGKDFLRLVEESISYRSQMNPSILKILPLNINMPGLFIEFMIVRYSLDGCRTEVLVHKSIQNESQLLSHDQPFPTVEFGFEYFFAMVVSSCYRHLLEEGANVVFAPSHVVRVKCHPNPMESLAHGISVRLYCQHKKSATKAIIRSPRYHWITVEDEETRTSFHMNKDQYRPTLQML